MLLAWSHVACHVVPHANLAAVGWVLSLAAKSQCTTLSCPSPPHSSPLFSQPAAGRRFRLGLKLLALPLLLKLLALAVKQRELVSAWHAHNVMARAFPGQRVPVRSTMVEFRLSLALPGWGERGGCEGRGGCKSWNTMVQRHHLGFTILDGASWELCIVQVTATV